MIATSAEAARRLPGLSIVDVLEPGDGSGWFDEPHAVIDESGAAQISFTSGTTGTPKGIILQHDALADVVERLNAAMAIDAGIREYVGVPATYSFGLGRFRAVAAAGGAAYIPPHGFDPGEIVRMLEAGEINALSAVPTLLRLILERPDAFRGVGRKMRWIETGSQPMSRPEKEVLKSLFPEARIVQHYGLTEASRTTFLDISRASGRSLESVGSPNGAAQIALDGEGRIRIRGRHVARQRIDADGIHSLTDEDGWLTTNDLGTIAGSELYFEGRADDLINCGGVKLVPDLVEDRLRTELALARGVAVARIPDAMRGDGVLVAYERGTGLEAAVVRATAEKVVAGFGIALGSSLRILAVDRLPVTDTGKLQRGVLTRLAAEEPAPAPSLPDAAGLPLREQIARLLGREAIPDNASFVSMGGDSLSYVQVSMLLDERLGHLPPNWEQLPIASLETLKQARPSRFGHVDSSILVRAVAILIVVLDHAWANSAGGAAVALMLVAGLNFSRFQVPKIVRGGAASLLETTFWRVLVPYFIFVTVTLVGHHKTFWPQYLLFANFTSGVYDHGSRLLVPYWFMEDYLLFVLLFTGLLTLPTVRRVVEARPWLFALGLFALSLPLGAYGAFHRDSRYFYEFTPLSVVWVFALGWLIHRAHTGRHKLVAGVLGAGSVGFFLVLPLFGSASVLASLPAVVRYAVLVATELVPLGLLIFVRNVPMPTIPARVLSAVASASLYIYMSHPFVLHFVSQKGGLPKALLAVLLSALVGILLWRCVDLIERHVVPLVRRGASLWKPQRLSASSRR